MPRQPKPRRGVTKRKESPYFQFNRRINGRRIKRSLQTTDIKRANELADELLREYEHSGSRWGGRVKVVQIGDEWLELVLKKRRNSNDRVTVAQRHHDYFEKFFEFCYLDNVGKMDLWKYKTFLEGFGLSAQTVDHIQALASQFFNWCVDVDLLHRNPVPPRGWRQKKRRRAPRRLQPSEADAVCALEGDRGFVCRLMRGTGLRWGEVCRLEVSDINWEARRITVRESKSDDRAVPLECKELFEEMRERFCGKHVGRLVTYSEKAPGSFIKTVRKKSGVQGYQNHKMRHTFGCEYIEGGGSMEALKEIMGHKSIETTQLYARMSACAVQKEAKRVQSGPRNGTTAATAAS